MKAISGYQRPVGHWWVFADGRAENQLGLIRTSLSGDGVITASREFSYLINKRIQVLVRPAHFGANLS